MLNIGQVVYDETNKRVIIFAGTRMLQNQETGKCWVEFGFIFKDGTFIHTKGGEEIPFKYTNLIRDGKAFLGIFIALAQCYGHYFGIIDGDNEEVKTYAKDAIEATEALITEHGLNTEECESHRGPYIRYHIGPIKEYEPKMTVSTPNITEG